VNRRNAANPDLTGTTAIVTGANSGVGLATATTLANRGAHVILAVRDTEKGADAAQTIAVDAEVRELDLADLASIRRFAAGWTGQVDLLINNAGVSVPQLLRTADEFELSFGTNYLGHFALTNLLLPHITGRVVSLASMAERMGRIDFEDLHWRRRTYNEFKAYAASKLANVLFTAELQRRLRRAGSSVIALVAHPGLVSTQIYRQSTGIMARIVPMFGQTPEDGALPVLYAATADLPGGGFTGPERWMHMRGGATQINRSKTARDPKTARRLWDVSEQITQTSFPATEALHRSNRLGSSRQDRPTDV
jgi:NAD(P)-dependent dehydrogenase (short-subunit alcohol dehydrogenase family)